MYNRKEFLLALLDRSGQLLKSIAAPPLAPGGSVGTSDTDTQSLFKEAMALGLDPASIPATKLETIVADLRNAKHDNIAEIEKEGGDEVQTGS